MTPNRRAGFTSALAVGAQIPNRLLELIVGNTVYVAPRFSASNFWRDVRDSRATWFVYVGETLRYLLAAPPSPLDKQHNVHSIFGNGLRPDV